VKQGIIGAREAELVFLQFFRDNGRRQPPTACTGPVLSGLERGPAPGRRGTRNP
jgi:hypothetical protein